MQFDSISSPGNYKQSHKLLIISPEKIRNGRFKHLIAYSKAYYQLILFATCDGESIQLFSFIKDYQEKIHFHHRNVTIMPTHLLKVQDILQYKDEEIQILQLDELTKKNKLKIMNEDNNAPIAPQ